MIFKLEMVGRKKRFKFTENCDTMAYKSICIYFYKI